LSAMTWLNRAGAERGSACDDIAIFSQAGARSGDVAH
jgi:hypothetical protein